jgi:hypothetical protein
VCAAVWPDGTTAQARPALPAPAHERRGDEPVHHRGAGRAGAAGRAATRLPAFAIALASIATLPAAIFLEIIVEPNSHNMFPIELFIYLLLQIPALLGALAGYGARRLLTGRQGLELDV